MGFQGAFRPERLLVAVLSAPDADQETLVAALGEGLGPVDFKRGAGVFGWSSYYEEEMGRGLVRTFYSFGRLVDPASLSSIKIWTNALEARFSSEGRRRHNLDPGLLSLSRLVLATTKNRAHRLPLRDGIYGELTLVYEKGGFQFLPWTYADWRSEKYRAILAELRSRLKEEL